jgi:hypothetical protein
MADIPQLDWPIRLAGIDYAEVEQDSTADAGASVAVLCCFERGTRAEAPDFGITDPAFQQQPVDTDEIAQQAAVYVPQATVTVTQTITPGGAAAVSVRVAITNIDDDEGG